MADFQRAIIRLSCYDILETKLCKQLGFFKQFDILPPENLKKLYPLIHLNGIDTKKVVQIHACKHRRKDGTLAVGYTVAGYERTDTIWRHSIHVSLHGRIESNSDPYLKGELYNLSQQAGNWPVTKGDLFDENEIEEKYESEYSQLVALKQIQQAVRGLIDDVEE